MLRLAEKLEELVKILQLRRHKDFSILTILSVGSLIVLILSGLAVSALD
jgi:hypothetical protein